MTNRLRDTAQKLLRRGDAQAFIDFTRDIAEGLSDTLEAVKCNGERISIPAPRSGPADIQQLAAAQAEFAKALVDLATRFEEGSITRVEMQIGFESAVVAADEIRKALCVLAGV
jgi:hypothetical protein